MLLILGLTMKRMGQWLKVLLLNRQLKDLKDLTNNIRLDSNNTR